MGMPIKQTQERKNPVVGNTVLTIMKNFNGFTLATKNPYRESGGYTYSPTDHVVCETLESLVEHLREAFELGAKVAKIEKTK